MTTVESALLVSSCGTTASAPAGSRAPVEIRTALPCRTVTPASAPAFASPMIRSCTDPSIVSAARIAKPSMAEP
jgi:hypothetical protein